MNFENVTIGKAVNEGKCLTRIDNLVVFTERTVPGDVADIEIHRKKKNFADAKVVRIHSHGPDYSPPICEHFSYCSGCKWQQLSYAAQLEMKQQIVAELLRNIGKVELPEIPAILGSPDPWHYRNKVEYTFTHKKWVPVLTQLDSEEHNALGFHIAGRFDKVLDIHTCYLQEDTGNRIRNFIKDYALKHAISFFNLREQHGLLRNLILRNNSKGEWMLILALHEDGGEVREALLDAIRAEFPEITSLCYVINGKRNDTIGDLDVIVYKGDGYLEEYLNELKFRISPKAFFQVNVKQALTLYTIAREYAALRPEDVVYDLYTGTGSIACFVAAQCKQVVGLEYVEEAIVDAKENARLNNIHNTAFYAGDIKDIFNEGLFRQYGKPDVLITDPPRTGMHDDVVKQILAATPSRIVYISCNVATQARDLALLDSLYAVTKVQPVDMFPHTSHVENIVCLELRNPAI